MVSSAGGISRRDFFRASAGGGFALGGVLGMGLDLRAAQTEARAFKFAGVREVPSVCPYCAVGCGQIVSVGTAGENKGKIVNIEGNPESPISRGTLCPKGAATFQLAVNPNRLTKVLYRRPRGTEWEEKPLDWAMERIARLVKDTRDQTFKHTAKVRTRDQDGNEKEVEKVVNHTTAIFSLGGATMDNEWNYVQAKLMRGLGVVAVENQARI
jgi:formate dehydrogenase major subunit